MSKIVCPHCGGLFSDMGVTKIHETFLERFWARVDKTGPHWLWLGKLEKLGYARIRRENSRERVLVHRLSWEIHRGPIPVGMKVLHKCDIRHCIKPDDLYLGTTQNNTDDMFARGRGNKAQGERHGRAKMSEKDARRLIALSREGKYTQGQLAEMFGLHPVHVNVFLKGHSWKQLWATLEAEEREVALSQS